MNVTYTQNLTEIYDSQHTAKQQLLTSNIMYIYIYIHIQKKKQMNIQAEEKVHLN